MLEVRKNLKNLKKKHDNSTSAILQGSIIDRDGKKVISYGEVVKTSTLRILSKKFYIKKPITIMRVSKNGNNLKNNSFIKWK